MPSQADPIAADSSDRQRSGNLLVACARAHLQTTSSDEVRQAATEPLNWPMVIAMAGEHGVKPLLWHGMELSGAAIPLAHRQTLSTHFQANAKRNLLLFGELIQIVRLMQAEGVRVLPYKGPILAQGVYGSLSLRQAGDLDIVVPTDDLARARQILEKRGYRLPESMDAVEQAAHADSTHEYHFQYTRKDIGAIVELHWKLAGSMFSFAADPAELWERSQMRAVGGCNLRLLSPEDNLLILAAHGLKHFWTRLGWICDIGELLRAEPAMDWEAVMRRAGELSCRRMTVLALLLARDLLGARVPSAVTAIANGSLRAQSRSVCQRLFAEMVDCDGLPRGGRAQLAAGTMGQSLWMHWQTRDRWYQGLRYGIARAIAPTALDRSRARLPRQLAFLHCLLRPIRLTKKYARIS